MTTALDSSIAQIVVKVLTTMGITITIDVDTVTNNQLTGTASISTSTYTVKATPPEAYAAHLVNGDSVQANDTRIFIAGVQSFTPVLNMRVTLGGLEHRVIRCTGVYSGDDVALWELQLRR